jgi:hypothetical protein
MGANLKLLDPTLIIILNFQKRNK